MNENPPALANPFKIGIRPVNPSGAPPPSLYQFILALITLYLIMRYVPKGEVVGVTLLVGAFLSTPDAVAGVVNLLAWLENPLGEQNQR